MFEIFVDDVVYYMTADHVLAEGKIQFIRGKRVRGKGKCIYTLYNGLSKSEDELFISLKRAKAYFEERHIVFQLPLGSEME